MQRGVLKIHTMKGKDQRGCGAGVAGEARRMKDMVLRIRGPEIWPDIERVIFSHVSN